MRILMLNYIIQKEHMDCQMRHFQLIEKYLSGNGILCNEVIIVISTLASYWC